MCEHTDIPDSVDDLLALLELTLGARHKLGLNTSRVVVTCPCERPTNHTDLARGLVDGDDITTMVSISEVNFTEN